MQRFGEKLRTLRKQHRMTLQQVADAIGVASDGFISNLEAGRKQPSVDIAIKIARLFNVSLDKFLLDEQNLDDNEAI